MAADPPSKPELSPEEAPAPQDPSLLPPTLVAPDLGGLYLEIENVVALALPEEIPGVFKGLRERLAGLKGTRAQQGQKVAQAIARTEELFLHLIQVREQMNAGTPSKR